MFNQLPSDPLVSRIDVDVAVAKLLVLSVVGVAGLEGLFFNWRVLFHRRTPPA